jgi:signal transduction histidine kinase
VLDKGEFSLGNVMNAVVSQVMILLRERDLQLIRDIPDEIKEASAYGDQYRIQQVLSDFLLSMVRFAPTENGWVEIQVRPNVKQNSDGTETMLFLFRLAAFMSLCNIQDDILLLRGLSLLELIENKYNNNYLKLDRSGVWIVVPCCMWLL